MVKEAIHIYNEMRPHLNLKYKTPEFPGVEPSIFHQRRPRYIFKLGVLSLPPKLAGLMRLKLISRYYLPGST
jgi:hypothetical protein